MNFPKLRAIVGALSLFALLGCEYKHPQMDLPPTYLQQAAWRAQVVKLRKIQDWDIKGRIASSASWGFSGSLSWQQRHEDFVIQAAGPLGIGAVEIAGNPHYVKVVSGDESYETFNPEADLKRVIGWPVSIQHLRQWVLALPIDAKAFSLKLGSDGWPKSIMQGGWRVEYQSYQELAGYIIPRKIVAERDDMEVKLVISDWLPKISEQVSEQAPEELVAETQPIESNEVAGVEIIDVSPVVSEESDELQMIVVSDGDSEPQIVSETANSNSEREELPLLENVVYDVLSELKQEQAISSTAVSTVNSGQGAEAASSRVPSEGATNKVQPTAAENPFFSNPRSRVGPRR